VLAVVPVAIISGGKLLHAPVVKLLLNSGRYVRPAIEVHFNVTIPFDIAMDWITGAALLPPGFTVILTRAVPRFVGPSFAWYMKLSGPE
jgi:hypothetical protein